MFFDGILKKFNVDYLSEDVSLHSGIPREYYKLKENKFKMYDTS